MSRLSVEQRLAELTERFKHSVIDDAHIMDPEGVHHEFVSDTHGRKLDFDKIATGSQLFSDWVLLSALRIRYLLGPNRSPNIVLGVARGANRLSPYVAATLGNGTLALTTVKIAADEVALTSESRDIISAEKPELLVVLEDVGTRGTTAASAAVAAKEAGARKVIVQNTWQRTFALPRLDEVSVEYDAIINEILPTYTTEECRAIGYCSLGQAPIPHISA